MRILTGLSILVCLILLPSSAFAVQIGGAGLTYDEKVPGSLQITGATTLGAITATGTIDAMGGIKFPDATIQTTAGITTSDASSTYVPYTGASKDIDLGSVRLTTTGSMSAGASSEVGTTNSKWTFSEFDATGMELGYIPMLTPTGSVLTTHGMIKASSMLQVGIGQSTAYTLSSDDLSKMCNLEYVWDGANDVLWIDSAVQIYDTDDTARAIDFTIGENDIETNPTFKLWGYLTNGTAPHSISHQINDTDDYYHITKDHANILGLAIDMPLNVTGTMESSNVKINSIGEGSETAVGIDASGNLVKNTSSLRYKKDVSSLEVDSAKIYDLKPVSFTWKKQGTRDFGLIAEDVEKTIPQLVNLDKDNKPESVKYDHISVLMVHEMKKLKQENEDLKKQINEIRSFLRLQKD